MSARDSSVAAALVVLVCAFGITFLVKPWSDTSINDLAVYRTDAGAFLAGRMPYSGQAFEYPPLAAPVLALPGIFGTSQPGYPVPFAVWMAVLAAAVMLLTRRLARQTGGAGRIAMFAIALSPLLTGAMIRTHFDLAPVALVLAALTLIVARRATLGMVVLGLAVMTKGFPLAIAPVTLAWLWAGTGRRAALRAGGALLATIALFVAIAYALSPSGAWDSLNYQTGRPPEVESTPAALLLAGGKLGVRGPEIRRSHRSAAIFHPAAKTSANVSYALGAVLLLLLSAAAARRPEARTLVLASLAGVAAFAAFDKVLSPQYLVWTLPLLALSLAWRRWALAATLALATLLTLVEFPANYLALLRQQSFQVWLVVARDLLLVASVWLALRALTHSRTSDARRRRAQRSTVATY